MKPVSIVPIENLDLNNLKRETHKILPHFEMVHEYPNIKINTDFLKVEDKNKKCCCVIS